MKTIYLSNGKGVLVDDIDYEWLNGFNWHDNGGYAIRGARKPDGTWTTIRMHREIAQRMGIEGNVDHINRNKLDNRRENLRGANHRENAQNQGLRYDNKSGHPGVRQVPSGRWHARIMHNYKYINLGTYDTYEEAKAARIEAEILYTGKAWEANPKCKI